MSSHSNTSSARTKRFAAEVFSCCKTDLSLSLLSHLGGTGKEIVSATVNPTDYTCADAFNRDYLCVELMSKYPHWDLGIDRAGVALEKFRSAEQACSRANARLIDFGANSKITVGAQILILQAKRKIQNLLGAYSALEAMSAYRFGPGATASKKRRHRDMYYKLGDPSPTCTANLLSDVYLIREMFPHWEFTVKGISGGKVTTVPKSAKTDRVICIEPDLNIIVQLGIGACIRRRLRRVGLLYPDAQERNALHAQEGSSTGRLATIDLSSASDTICKELVRTLLPPDWLRALEGARSPVALLRGVSVPLEKFSAMGNGYTFELETLIFWGLCRAVVDSHPDWDQRVLVYGDDIIVDSRAVSVISDLFAEVGFTMNPKKTFANGPFRESCGKHYFRGVDVSPFYVKDNLQGHKWFWAANSVRRFSRLSWGLDSRFFPAYSYAVHCIPDRWKRILIPDGVGDVGLIVDFDEACPQRVTGGQQGYRYKYLYEPTVQREVRGPARIMKSLFNLERSHEESSSSVPIGNKPPRVRKDGFTRLWQSFGPWL